MDRLRDIARGAELPLILMYGDPDPDAIAAACGLATIWRLAGVQLLFATQARSNVIKQTSAQLPQRAH